jgi:hypothetical protein
MIGQTVFGTLREELTAYISPLRQVARSTDPPAALLHFLKTMRWDIPLPSDGVQEVIDAWEAVITSVEALNEVEDAGTLFGAIETLDAAGEAIARLNDLPASIQSFAEDFDWQQLGSELITDTLQTLTVLWLGRFHPVLYRVLSIVGLVHPESIPELLAADDGPIARHAHSAQRVDAAALLPLISNPVEALQTLYGVTGIEDSETAQALSLLVGDRLGELARGFGGIGFAGARMPAGLANPRMVGFNIPLPSGINLYGLPPIRVSLELLSPDDVDASGHRGPGLALSLPSLTTQTVKLPGWTLDLEAVNVETPLFIGPDGIGSSIGGPVKLSFNCARVRSGPLVFGGGGTRLEIGLPQLGGWFELDGGSADFGFQLTAPGSGLYVGVGDGDAFVGALLNKLDLALPFDVGLLWSQARGVELSGGSGFHVYVPASLTLGPLTIGQIEIELTIDGSLLTLAFMAEVGCTLGPFHAAVRGLGVEGVLDFAAPGIRNLGFTHLTFRLHPPYRVEFAIATGPVNGGGVIAYEEATGRYYGALSLDILAVGIDAVVIVDTQLPGDPSGWAFFASLTASFPGVPLGFGFTLLGVGGLIALNRSLDAEALAAGLRTGAVNALLFPDDPVGDIDELIVMMDDFFPFADGNTVVGPVIQIGWGTPTLITGQLGVVISLPEGIIAVMGSLYALLPTPEAPLLVINMDCLGVLDFGEGTLTLAASVYDSRLLATIDLSGDMALYLRATSQPYFLLSVGGFHPGFDPPSLLPAFLYDLRRMQASITLASNVSVSIEAYFALTSNSVQFGAAVNLLASVEVWPTTYVARGWFAFNVLLEFSPFRFEATMSAGVGVYAGDRELTGVQLTVLLEGPKPWVASCNARFRFFGIWVPFSFDIGSGAGSEPRPLAYPVSDALNAMRTTAAWGEAEPLPGLGSGIVYTGSPVEEEADEPADLVWVRPDYQLTVRQTIAPFDRKLDIVGQAVPDAAETELSVTDVGFGDASIDDWEHALDWFAPAQFEQLTPAERLDRASFEEMPSGVIFGIADVAITNWPKELGANVTTDYEEGTFQNSIATGAAGRARRHHAPQDRPLFAIRQTAYTLASTATGAEAKRVLREGGLAVGGVSQYDALGLRRKQASADSGTKSQYVVVPVAAVEEEVT